MLGISREMRGSCERVHVGCAGPASRRGESWVKYRGEVAWAAWAAGGAHLSKKRRRAAARRAGMICSSPQIPGGSGTSGSSCARSPNAVSWSPRVAAARPMAQVESERAHQRPFDRDRDRDRASACLHHQNDPPPPGFDPGLTLRWLGSPRGSHGGPRRAPKCLDPTGCCHRARFDVDLHEQGRHVSSFKARCTGIPGVREVSMRACVSRFEWQAHKAIFAQTRLADPT
eukprot:5129191-Prymnesium_polylepis.2